MARRAFETATRRRRSRRDLHKRGPSKPRRASTRAVDTEDLATLGQLLSLAAEYIDDQDEAGEQGNVTKMQGVVHTLAGLVAFEAGEDEPDEPEDESDNAGRSRKPDSRFRSARFVADAADVDVLLSDHARRELEKLARATGTGRAETGGMLFGWRESEWQRRIDILKVTGPGPDARRTAESFRNDAKHDSELARAIRSGDGELVEVGSWHSHPLADSIEPSDSDLGAWGQVHDRLALTRSVELIVTPTSGIGWMAPNFHAFVVSARSSRLVCERAKVVEPGTPLPPR